MTVVQWKITIYDEQGVSVFSGWFNHYLFL